MFVNPAPGCCVRSDAWATSQWRAHVRGARPAGHGHQGASLAQAGSLAKHVHSPRPTTLGILRTCITEATDHPADQLPLTVERLSDMLEFLELTDAWGERAAKLSPQNLKRLSKLGDSIFRLVG